MALLKLKEYLNNAGKTIEKAADIMTADIEKGPDRPEKNVIKGKNYKFPAALDGNPLPYAAKTMKDPQGKDGETGLGSIGTPDIEYGKTKELDSYSQLQEHCGCENKKAPFVVAYASGAYHPDPIQAIKYIVYLTNENENILKALMHEAKKAGCYKKYVNYINSGIGRKEII